MDFQFSDEQQAFAKEVEAFLDANDDPDVFDVTRENMAQIVDTPKRREFMAKLGEKGWLGITWPEEYGGQDGEGVYEYLLNEQLAGRGGPQIGKGVGIIGKTIIAHGSEKLKEEFLPKILKNEVEFAVGYSEPNAGSDAASMQLKATKDGDGWRLNGQKTWTTSAHFAECDAEYADSLRESQRDSAGALRALARERWWAAQVKVTMRVMNAARDEVNAFLRARSGGPYLKMAYEEVLMEWASSCIAFND